MSLLDTASLLLTPNAYKEGKLYSVIPSDGSGDFTFTRATPPTRVNSDGLVELVPYNLLQRSEEFENAAWTKANVTISANTTTAPNGTLTADSLIENSATSTHLILQSATLSAINYTYSVYVKAISGSTRNVGILFNTTGKGVLVNPSTGAVVSYFNTTAADVTISNVGNGWFRVSVTALTAAITESIRINLGNGTTWTAPYLGDGTSGVYIWGAQLVEGTNALPYQRTETRLNIPRLDYSLGGCPNILLEPQRTNLALRSQEFDNASWVKEFASITANQIDSPSGVQDADKLTENSANQIHGLYNQVAYTSVTTATASIFFKKGTRKFFSIKLLIGANSYTQVYDSESVTTTSNSSNGLTSVSTSIVDFGNGWVRATLTGTNPSGAAAAYIIYCLSDSGTPAFNPANFNPTYQGTGTDYGYIWGAQLEAGAYATSYIPTTSASVTRNADLAQSNNIYTNGFISASGGTWYFELKNNRSLVRDAFASGISFLTSTGQDGFRIRNTIGTTVFLVIEKLVANVSTNLYTMIVNNVKVAIKWNGTTADVFVNGVKVVAATTFTATVMQNIAANGGDVPKYISSMLLAPTPLTDDECIQLTTL